MTDPMQKVTAKALRFNEEQRAELARILLLSLDGAGEDVDERIWAEEAERRYEELRDGRSEGIPSEQVFAEARDLLK